MAKRQKPEITSLYYICHINNISSIIEHGVLSHNAIIKKEINFEKIYDSQIVSNRQAKRAPNNESLWGFANVYFQPRNPMLYRVLHEVKPKNVAIIGIRPQIIGQQGVFITDGNAAHSATNFYDSARGIKSIHKDWNTIRAEWWNSSDGSKRRIMAECLVPDHIPASYIHSIFVANHSIAENLRNKISSDNIQVIPEPQMFFRPIRRHRLTAQLNLAEGDMFFSTMQTLTVSVNTVGIMGKGVASRAKYQFPDVYVTYQDACRKKRLEMGKPYLYKREASLDIDLIDILDHPSEIQTINDVKWFLLFPTKNHWRQNSDRDGIEKGLDWLIKNQAKNNIESLALPALGCGLGNLEWGEIGPLMCRKLIKLGIPVTIYLPRERPVEKELLTPEFLLGTNR